MPALIIGKELIMRFVLVHGGYHGAWCWDRLIPELKKRGHTAIAVDLPGHGTKAGEPGVPSMADYRKAVLDVLEKDDVLVGHSMGGLIISDVAAAAPEKIGHLIYLSTILPKEWHAFAGGRGMQSLVNGGMKAIAGLSRPFPGMQLTASDHGSVSTVKAKFATWAFYNDCDPQLAQWACERLCPEYTPPLVEPLHLAGLWDSQPTRSLILGTQDHLLNPKVFPADSKMFRRFGCKPIYLEGSHSTYLSMPAECAAAMIDTVGSAPTGPLLPS